MGATITYSLAVSAEEVLLHALSRDLVPIAHAQIHEVSLLLSCVMLLTSDLAPMSRSISSLLTAAAMLLSSLPTFRTQTHFNQQHLLPVLATQLAIGSEDDA